MFSEDDKRWIIERFEKVEERIEKVDVRFAERIEKVEERFAERIEKVEERFAERIEKVETTLLTEFHKWASPIEMRQRTHTATLRALDEEMEALSDRVKNLEGR
jgi:DNA anti-recombination protein RmuC